MNENQNNNITPNLNNSQNSINSNINNISQTQNSVVQPVNNIQTVATQPTVQPMTTPQPSVQTMTTPQPSVQPMTTPQPSVQTVASPQPNIQTVATQPTVQTVTTPQPNTENIQENNEQVEEKNDIQQDNIPKEYNLELLNPLNPDEILKTEILKPEDLKEENDKNESEKKSATKSNNNKKKKLNLKILLIALVAIILLIIIYFTFFNKPDKEPQQGEPPITTVTKLNNIFLKLQNNPNYQILTQNLTVTNVINEDMLSISIANEENTFTYNYTLKNDILSTEYNINDPYGYELTTLLFDAVAQNNELAENQLYNYLKTIDLNINIVNGIEYSENYDTVNISIKTNQKIDTSLINTAYISINDFKQYEEFLKNSGNVQFNKNNLLFYKTNINNQIIITIGEKNELTRLTQLSIIDLISLLYSDELEYFKSNFINLDNNSFGKYTVTINPTLDTTLQNIYANEINTHKFIEIRINL